VKANFMQEMLIPRGCRGNRGSLPGLPGRGAVASGFDSVDTREKDWRLAVERGGTKHIRSAVVYALRVPRLGDSQTIEALVEAGEGYCTREGLRQSGAFSDDTDLGAVDRPGLMAAMNQAMDDPSICCLAVSLPSELSWIPAEIRMVSKLLAEVDVRTRIIAGGALLPDMTRCWLDALLEEKESPAHWRRLKRSRLEYLRVQGRERVSQAPPNGYRITSLKSGKRFISEDPVPAAIVRAVFELFAFEKNSVEDILKYLNGMPGINEFGHGHIDDRDLVAILKNRSYLGEVRICWQEWIPGNFPALVDRRTFMAAGRRLRKTLSAASAEEEEQG